MPTFKDIARIRLIAQRLTTPSGSATEVVRWMTCTQAQDFPAGRTAIALRTASHSLAEVDAALNTGEVVRSWPMRGTLHLVAAEDLGWMLDLTHERQIRQARARAEEFGITPAVDAQVEAVTREVLRGDGLDRKTLIDAWSQAGIDTANQRSNHLMTRLAVLSIICLGPLAGRQQRFVLNDEWITTPRALTREESIVEWAQRYFRSHGPAPVKDFLWWTKLLVSEVKPLLEEIRKPLLSMQIGDDEYLADSEVVAAYDRDRRATTRPHLLPAFDEILLGYGDRSPALEPGHQELVVPGDNGVFRSTLVHHGRIIATWRKPAKATDAVTVEPFGSVPAGVERQIGRLSKALPRD